MDPLTLGLAGGLLQGALGFFGAKKKAAEAARQESFNQEMNQADTRFSGFLGQQGKRAEQIERPDVLGATLGGALGGAQQGLNVYAGMQGIDKNKILLEKLKNANPEDAAKLLGK
jgi:hypothetical protein